MGPNLIRLKPNADLGLIRPDHVGLGLVKFIVQLIDAVPLHALLLDRIGSRCVRLSRLFRPTPSFKTVAVLSPCMSLHPQAELHINRRNFTSTGFIAH
jgi:hypothetical protein